MLIKTAAASVKYPSIGIVGAGIGGLTAANALLHKPDLVDRVSLYEQAPHFIPTAGAGFGLSPNGQICLSSIGIDGYRSLVHPFDRVKRMTKEGTSVTQESNVFQQLRERHGFGVAGCLRADLVDLLVDHLKQQQPQNSTPVHYSHALTRITPHQDKVDLEFANGHEDVVDLVIAADGIHSTISKQLNIDDAVPPIYSGANIIYGKIPQPDRFDSLREHPIFTPGAVVNGPGTGELIGFYAGAGSKRTFNTYVAQEPPPKRDEWNQGHAEEVDAIIAKFPSTHPIHEFSKLSATDGDLLHFGLYYRHHKKTWTHGRVVLLGDACHATLPYVGQGANQAMEDAITLADCLEQQDTYTVAYQEYYQRRFPRTKRVVQVAGLMHKLYHSEHWMMQTALDYLLRSVVKGGAFFKLLEREIVQECPVHDYRQYAPKEK
jgi:salicylate hydroxylase